MLGSFFAVRPTERRHTLAACLTLLLAMAGHALLETARDALFLARLPATRLPWVYLAIAAAALTIGALQDRLPLRSGGRLRLSLWLVASAGVTLMFWALVGRAEAWWLFAFYAWTGVFGTLVLVRFWLVLQELFTVTQAKRLFALIGSGGVLGAIIGSALAGVVASMLGAQALLPVAAGFFLLSATLPLLTPRPPRIESPVTGEASSLGEALRLVRRRPYLRLVATLILVSTVTLTIVDYVFKSAVAERVPADELGGFFAAVYTILNILSLVFQLALAGWLLRVYGVSRALGLLPVLLVLGGAGVALGGGLIAALVLKTGDGGLRYSVHRTALEVLYVPVPAAVRRRVKGFVDVLGQRGGQALASIGLLAAAALGVPVAVLGVIVVALAGIWLYLADSLQSHYLELFRATLREGDSRPREAFEALDVSSLESLIAALSSQNDAEVVASLDLLAERGKIRLIPLLLFYHPSSRVLLRALDLFVEAGREDVAPMVPRLMQNPDPEVRAAALRAAATAALEPSLLEAGLNDVSPVVQLTALVGRVAIGAPEASRALATIETVARDGDHDSKRALARAIQHQRSSVFEGVLLALAADHAPSVRREVVHAMRHQSNPRFVAALVPMLERRELRGAVREALVEIGAEAFAFLERALSDPETPLRQRRHLPRTLSRFDPKAAAAVLVARLPQEPDGLVRYKILRALGRIRADASHVPMDAGVLGEMTEQTLKLAFRLLNWRLDLERGARLAPARATPVHDLLVTTLRHKEAHVIERLFRLLGLMSPREDVYRIYRGLQSDDPNARASGLELLGHLLRSPMREAILGLLDDVDDSQRLMAAGRYHAPRSSLYSVVLHEILLSGGTTLPAFAAYHAGELGIHEVRDDLRALAPAAPQLLRAALGRSLELMSQPGAERLVYGA